MLCVIQAKHKKSDKWRTVSKSFLDYSDAYDHMKDMTDNRYINKSGKVSGHQTYVRIKCKEGLWLRKP